MCVMSNNKIFLFLGASLSLIPDLSAAQCVATQDCATLGYTETSCNGGKGVKCPFGNKWCCFETEEEIKETLCPELGFKFDCLGEGYTGGSGKDCNGKYAACICSLGYKWDKERCQKEILTGPDGNVYKCNGKVVGVKTSDMNFYIAMGDLGTMRRDNAKYECENYLFCDGKKGTYPGKDSMLTVYDNKVALNNLLITYGGKELSGGWFWTSTKSPLTSAYYTYIVSLSSGEVGESHGGSYRDKYYALPIIYR